MNHWYLRQGYAAIPLRVFTFKGGFYTHYLEFFSIKFMCRYRHIVISNYGQTTEAKTIKACEDVSPTLDIFLCDDLVI